MRPRLARPAVGCASNAALNMRAFAHPAATAPVPLFGDRRRFNMRDRMLLLAWSEHAAAIGLSRITLHAPEWDDDPEVAGEFLLIYPKCQQWARWGVAPTPPGYLVWATASGANLACCATLRQAFSVIDATAAG